MVNITVQYAEDDETGILGLRPIGLPSDMNSSVEGYAVAHDVLEHLNGFENIGPIADELQALGAMWYIRGQFGMLSKRGTIYSPHESIAFDLSRMFEDFYLHNSYLPIPPKTKKCDFDDDFHDIIKLMLEKGWFDSSDIRPDHDSVVKLYKRAALSYMRIGYRKAKKRYEDSNKINMLFWRMSEAFDDILKYCDFEGQKWVLSYCIKNATVSYREASESEYNYF